MKTNKIIALTAILSLGLGVAYFLGPSKTTVLAAKTFPIANSSIHCQITSKIGKKRIDKFYVTMTQIHITCKKGENLVDQTAYVVNSMPVKAGSLVQKGSNVIEATVYTHANSPMRTFSITIGGTNSLNSIWVPVMPKRLF